jgi:hypothetical protein
MRCALTPASTSIFVFPAATKEQLPLELLAIV